MDAKTVIELITLIVALLGFTVAIMRWVNSEIAKVYDKINNKVRDLVPTATCKIIHSGTTKDIDRIEKALNEGLKMIYDKFDKLNDLIAQLIQKGN